MGCPGGLWCTNRSRKPKPSRILTPRGRSDRCQRPGGTVARSHTGITGRSPGAPFLHISQDTKHDTQKHAAGFMSRVLEVALALILAERPRAGHHSPNGQPVDPRSDRHRRRKLAADGQDESRWVRTASSPRRCQALNVIPVAFQPAPSRRRGMSYAPQTSHMPPPRSASSTL